MADEPTPAPAHEQDTPTPAASRTEKPATESPKDGEESAPAVDWEQRYSDLRPEFDRKNQLLSAAEGHHGLEAQMQALQQLGVQVEYEEDPEYDEYDEYEDPDDRLDRIEEALSERSEAEADAEFQWLEEQYIDSTLSAIEEKEGVQLSDTEARFVVTNALANRHDDGRPNLQGAFDDLKGIKSAARDEYLASKKAPRAPVGTPGEEKIDLSDTDARRKYMAEVMEAEGGSE